MSVPPIVTHGSTVILVLATILNIIFIYMIRNGMRSAVGQAYKNIMTCFAVCNITFASIEFIVKPGIHVYGTSLITFSHGMYGVNTALLALHFVYRYIFLCRQSLLCIFHGKASIAAVILSVLSWGFAYGLITFYCFAADENYYKYASSSLYAEFGIDARSLSFFCIFTHEVNGNTTTIHWMSTVGLSLIYIMMIITFSVMVLCGIEMYRTLKKSSMSHNTYVCSFRIYQFMPLVVTSYTVIDPIAIMFLACDFRGTVSNLKKAHERHALYDKSNSSGLSGNNKSTISHVFQNKWCTIIKYDRSLSCKKCV
ncbi:7TM chemoreceptor [Cooperia oncophora]